MSASVPPSAPAPDFPVLHAPVVGRIWHLSDVHFDPRSRPGAADEKLIAVAAPPGLFDMDVFRRIKDLAGELPADVLVVSGDFVYAPAVKARAATPPAPAPALATPPPPASGPSWWDRVRGRRVAAPASAAGRTRPSAASAALPSAAPATPSPRQQEFALARQFVDELAAALGIGPDEALRRVVVCPGNHDVDREMSCTRPGENLAEFNAAFDGLCRPAADDPVVLDRARGLCLLPVDTAFLGGTTFRDRSTNVEYQLDAPVYPLRTIREAVRKALPGGVVPYGVLGVVVAHHPPGNSATSQAEVTSVEHPLGAEQAKAELFDEGFRLVLHGHKHEAVAQVEVAHRLNAREAQRMLVLGATTFWSVGTHGFHVIDYAVAPDTGDARLRVTPYVIDGDRPRGTEPWHLAVPARARSEARVIRVLERISPHGDSRTDVCYDEVPAPGTSTAPAWGGWTRDGAFWTRTFTRVEHVPGGHFIPPVATAGDPAVTVDARIGAEAPESSRRRIDVVVRAPATVSHISVVERTFGMNEYAVSGAHQALVTGVSQSLRGFAPGWEVLAFSVREPAERLEIDVALPFAPEVGLRPSVLPCRPAIDAPFAHDPALDPFTRSHVEVIAGARRIRATVVSPLVGVTYALVWPLPRNAPAVAALSDPERLARQYALHEAERYRGALLAAAGPAGTAPHPERYVALDAALRTMMDGFHRRLVDAGHLDGDEALEWSLFLTDTSVNRPNPPTQRDPRPHLLPVCGNYDQFPGADAAWDCRWPAGSGVAGRAFAADALADFHSPDSAGYDPVHTPDPWVDPYVPYYWPLRGRARHAVLYGLPVRHPTYAGPGVVLGAFCVGSFRPRSRLSLKALIPETPDEGRRRHAAQRQVDIAEDRVTAADDAAEPPVKHLPAQIVLMGILLSTLQTVLDDAGVVNAAPQGVR